MVTLDVTASDGAWSLRVTDSQGKEWVKTADPDVVSGIAGSVLVLRAVTLGLGRIKKSEEVLVKVNSPYVVNALNKGWVESWEKAHWKRGKGLVPNYQLWQKLLMAVEGHYSVRFELA